MRLAVLALALGAASAACPFAAMMAQSSLPSYVAKTPEQARHAAQFAAEVTSIDWTAVANDIKAMFTTNQVAIRSAAQRVVRST
jgi:hypothetical protein